MKRRKPVHGLAVIYLIIAATVTFYGLAIDPLLDQFFLWLENWLTS